VVVNTVMVAQLLVTRAAMTVAGMSIRLPMFFSLIEFADWFNCAWALKA